MPLGLQERENPNELKNLGPEKLPNWTLKWAGVGLEIGPDIIELFNPTTQPNQNTTLKTRPQNLPPSWTHSAPQQQIRRMGMLAQKTHHNFRSKKSVGFVSCISG